MRKLFILLLFLATSSNAATVMLDSTSITYLGWFKAPTTAVFNFGLTDMTYVPDCGWATDPTPVGTDGYAGCLIGVDSDVSQTVAMMDIVAPTMTGVNTASEVIGAWDITESVPENATPPRPDSGMNKLAVYYEEGPPCKIRWILMKHYANLPFDDDELFGFSDCSHTTPNAQGMWRFDDTAQIDTSVTDPYRVTSWVFNLERVPAGPCTDYFGGDCMMLGPGKSVGSRGSSAGPSFGVRPWTWPTDDSDYDGFTPIITYPEGRYPEWTDVSLYQWPLSPLWTGASKSDHYPGQHVVRITTGGNDYEALIVIGSKPVVDNRIYPLSEYATARPDQSSSYTTMEAGVPTPAPDPPGGQWDTYASRSTGGDLWPDITLHPQEDYGIESYSAASSIKQQPAFVDVDKNGALVPFDTRIVSTCSHGTGPSISAAKTYLIFYELAELGAIYAGTSGYTYQTIQPYEAMEITIDPNNDGFDVPDSCVQPTRFFGTAYDYTNNILFVAHSSAYSGTSAPWSEVAQRGVSMWKIEPPTGVPPAAPVGESKGDGGGVAGGKVE